MLLWLVGTRQFYAALRKFAKLLNNGQLEIPWPLWQRTSMAANNPPANVYIDGFNLYRGCLENSPYKWLDLVALAEPGCYR